MIPDRAPDRSVTINVFAAEAKSFIAKTMRMPRVMEGL